MARIGWISSEQASPQLAAVLDSARKLNSKGQIPDLFLTMTHAPEFLSGMLSAVRFHFAHGALSVAQHEMIATYVSALNSCDY